MAANPASRTSAPFTTYDAQRFGVELPTDVPATLQECAYSSPIWYTPP